MTRDELLSFTFSEDNHVNMFYMQDKVDILLNSLEEQNQGLQSLLYLKQQEISVLESKVGEVKTCGTCKYWYEKSCSNNDGIAYNGTNAVYEDDYCKDYEAKQ